MKVGYTAREAYSMYRSLSKEVFDFYDYQHPRPRYRTSSLQSFAVWAQTDFAPLGNNGKRIAYSDLSPYATLVEIGRDILPVVYEDELIGLILHELAHVIAGFHAQHDELWQETTKELGGWHYPMLRLRRENDIRGFYRYDHAAIGYADVH